MKTTWNDKTAFYLAKMDFDKIDTSDPLVLSHLKFSLGAALTGNYLTEGQKKLMGHWLSMDEQQHRLHQRQKENWKQKLLDYALPLIPSNRETPSGINKAGQQEIDNSEINLISPVQNPAPQEDSYDQSDTTSTSTDDEVRENILSNWDLYDEWLKYDPRCKEYLLKIKESGLPLQDIVYPSSEPPPEFTSPKLNELLNDFLNYTDRWLMKHGFDPAPAIDGYKKGALPPFPVKDLIQYVTRRDPLLFPTLMHIIRIAFRGKHQLKGTSREILKHRLHWFNRVTLPDGMEINWGQEYEKIFHQSKKWRSTPPLLADSSLKLPEEDETFIKKHLPILKPQDGLYMTTTWNDKLALYDAYMQFNRIKTDDPLLIPHIKFSLKAALTGNYYTEKRYKLLNLWLKNDESECRLNMAQKSSWKKAIMDYQLPTLAHSQRSKGNNKSTTTFDVGLLLKKMGSVPKTHKNKLHTLSKNKKQVQFNLTQDDIFDDMDKSFPRGPYYQHHRCTIKHSKGAY